MERERGNNGGDMNEGEEETNMTHSARVLRAVLYILLSRALWIGLDSNPPDALEPPCRDADHDHRSPTLMGHECIISWLDLANQSPLH